MFILKIAEDIYVVLTEELVAYWMMAVIIAAVLGIGAFVIYYFLNLIYPDKATGPKCCPDCKDDAMYPWCDHQYNGRPWYRCPSCKLVWNWETGERQESSKHIKGKYLDAPDTLAAPLLRIITADEWERAAEVRSRTRPVKSSTKPPSQVEEDSAADIREVEGNSSSLTPGFTSREAYEAKMREWRRKISGNNKSGPPIRISSKVPSNPTRAPLLSLAARHRLGRLLFGMFAASIGVPIGLIERILLYQDPERSGRFQNWFSEAITVFGWWTVPPAIMFAWGYFRAGGSTQKTKASYTVAYGPRTGVQVAVTRIPTGDVIPGLEHDEALDASDGWIMLWLLGTPLMWVVYSMYVLVAHPEQFNELDIVLPLLSPLILIAFGITAQDRAAGLVQAARRCVILGWWSIVGIAIGVIFL